ncbi:MAG: glycosyltransferase [Actinomycetota bacterium]
MNVRAGESADPTDRPRFSILTAVYETVPEHLAECLSSVDSQTETSWEHLVVDDASTRTDLAEVFAAHDDERRRVVRRTHNGGIVAASNDALAMATGEYVVLLDHDDVLEANALEAFARAIDGEPGATAGYDRIVWPATGRAVPVRDPDARVDVLYSDHDLLRPDGRRATPLYKPIFSLERLRNHNYITHLVCARRELVEEVGGFTPGLDGAQDHDLLLRLAEVASPFTHVPELLLHWRQSPDSVAADPDNKPYAFDAGVTAVQQHLDRVGIDAAVSLGPWPGIVTIDREVAARPTVSVVIPTRGTVGRVWGATRCFVHEAVRSILDAAADAGDDGTAGDARDDASGVSRPGGVELEIVVVLDAESDPMVAAGLRRIAGDRLVLVHHDEPFNFSVKCNRGVDAASGEYVLLLNDDTELIEPRSIERMVGIAQQDDVGLVGARLLYEDGRLQHAGHWYHGTIHHLFNGFDGETPGPYGMLAVERECAGVTAAAALARRATYRALGGMDPAFGANYNDVDLSRRMREAGQRIVYTPRACWYHFEQQSFDHPIADAEKALLEERYGHMSLYDPYAHPLLTPGRIDHLELPHHSGAPPI